MKTFWTGSNENATRFALALHSRARLRGLIDSAGNFISENGASRGVSTLGFQLPNVATASHEALHSLGLAHSFAAVEAQSQAQFTYQPLKTDNLMDYSHLAVPQINRISLWDWQTLIANASSDQQP